MRFYSMSYESVLDLQIRTFFALNREANRLQAKEYHELMMITLSPTMKQEYNQSKLNHYIRIIHGEKLKAPIPPPRPGGLDLSTPEAKNRLIKTFAGYRRNLGLGHGRRLS